MNLMVTLSNLGAGLGMAEKFQSACEQNGITGFGFLKPILAMLDQLLIPAFIALLAAAVIYSIVLGVNMARADGAEKREDAKKRLVNFLIGILIIIVLLVLIYALADNLGTILTYVQNSSSGTAGGNAGA